MEEDLPIDIHYNKLLDWLVSRRHCNAQWNKAALVVREKINTAIQDMPPVDEITKLLQGTYINYFHCKKIVSLLKETDDGSRTLFGGYSSQRMKDWLEILKLYEKDDLYLAEAAQMLSRNVNYEIPALKKQIAKCQQTQSDCSRKEAEHAGSAGALREKFNASCRHMSIEGKKIRQELLSLADDLPTTFSRIAEKVKGLRDAVDFYSGFVSFMTGSPEIGDACILMVKYVIQSGNTTTYEWRTGHAPQRIEQLTLDLRNDDEDEKVCDDDDNGEIDWGDLDEVPDEIDYGIETTEEDMKNSDLAIELTDTLDIEVVDNSGVLVDQSREEGVARGSDALTLLDNPKTREEFIDELLELEAFLSQREVEGRREVTAIDSVQFHGAPAQIDRDDVDTLLRLTREPLALLTSDHFRELALIRNSPRYVERMTSTLKKLLADAEKMSSLSRLMVVRRAEAVEEETATVPKLNLIRTRTKELQKEISESISKKYKNRRVNIMGEINTI